MCRPVGGGNGTGIEIREILLEENLSRPGSDLPHLKLAGPRRDEQAPAPIPICPLHVVQERQFAVRFERILHAQAVNRLFLPELPSCMSDAFNTQLLKSAWLALRQTGVSTLVPGVARMPRRRIRRFFPSAPSFRGELHRWNGL